MSLSGKIFGFSSWSMLIPQALMGVGHRGAAARRGAPGRRRRRGSARRSSAGLTPVAALMFRFNNPDALLVLLLVTAAYCVTRALDGAAPRSHYRWLAPGRRSAGFRVSGQAAPSAAHHTGFGSGRAGGATRRRVAPRPLLAVGLTTMVIGAGWYVALVELWPAASRPYIGGSTNNSLLELTLGYNGLGRVLGGEGNPAPPAAQRPPISPAADPAGWLRRISRYREAFRRRDGNRDLLAAAAALIRWRPGCGTPAAPHAPITPAPPCCCGAAGWW